MKIAIIGYGKMGRMIDQLATSMGHQIVLKIDHTNPADFTIDNLRTADVAIEFSQPEAAFQNIKACLEANTPIVSGTTGWLDRKAEIETICEQQNGAFLYASNFSIGVNIFFKINQILAKMMGQHSQYSPSMEEIHHTQKLDAPSGTAITLAEAILSENQFKDTWVNQDAAQDNELSIISKRIDKVPGTHSINYQSSIDSIEIKHTAHSREGFARGAILAAEWIIGRQGSFSMDDVLDL